VADRNYSGLVARLNRLNPTAVFLAVLALMLLALFVPGWPGAVLALALAALAVLLMTARREAPAARRVLPLLVAALLVAVAIGKIF
jgi:hypothetical protein